MKGLNMSTLIVPAAGKSSRFPGMRPKWLLTMPDGNLMIEHAIRGIVQNNNFDRIIVVCLEEHVSKFTSLDKLNTILESAGGQPVELLTLEKPTDSQSETVLQALQRMKVEGPFLIKDCDNYFNFQWNKGYQIAVVDVETVDGVDIRNKSYVRIDPMKIVQNIVEKKIISNLFCCGAYGFASSEQFIESYQSIQSASEIYVSHVIFKSILSGCNFEIEIADRYIDWGTMDAYHKHMNNSFTIFCDLDGVLLKNSSKFAPGGWTSTANNENLKSLQLLMKHKNIYLVITTSRPESDKSNVEKILHDYGIVAQNYVMGLPHGKRILINDYSQTNPYPTAISLNIERDSEKLNMLLKDLV
jgi:hypothetical protein